YPSSRRREAPRVAPRPGSKEGGESSVRALDCECGRHLEAGDDRELFERAREHVDRDHPEMNLSDEQVQAIVEQGAYDK
ncbi:MAG: DUF1059 domain-containing protein, partial [Actinomycetota bacterium]